MLQNKHETALAHKREHLFFVHEPLGQQGNSNQRSAWLGAFTYLSSVMSYLGSWTDLWALSCPGPRLGQLSWHHFAPCSSSRRTESNMFSWQRQRSKKRECHQASWGLALEPPPCHFCHFLLANKVMRPARVQRVGKQISPPNERNYKDILQGLWL